MLEREGFMKVCETRKGTVQARVVCGVRMTESFFGVKVGLHQGSVLCPFLFNTVFDVLTKGVREGTPWDMMYADGVMLLSETKEGIKRRLDEWREALESRGIKISTTKTEYMRRICVCTKQEQDGEDTIRLDGLSLQRVDSFRYLGSTLSSDGN